MQGDPVSLTNESMKLLKLSLACALLAGPFSFQTHVRAEEENEKADKKSNHPIVEFTVPSGTFQVELYPEHAPKHVERMLTLVEEGFYDGIRFHRVEEGILVQAGDPLSKKQLDPPVGSGGSDYPNLPLEVTEELKHQAGTLAAARKPMPDSANSQFYICLQPIPSLNMQYSIYGQVIGDGLDVVKEIRRGDAIENAKVVRGASAKPDDKENPE